MTRIRLFSSAYPEGRLQRRRELSECLLRNLACREIDEVIVFVEGDVDLPFHPKLRRLDVSGRPMYSDYLEQIEKTAAPDDHSIIANSDIYFDNGIGVLRHRPIPPDTVFAIARWETGLRAGLNDRNDSQDSWVFRGNPRQIGAAFPVGVPRCDNRFTKELELAGYRVLNPAFSIRAHHLHDEQRVEYPVNNERGFVDGPYGYVWPHNLMSLPASLWHNLRNPESRIGWRLDRRQWKSRLKFHWMGAALRIVRRRHPA